MTQRNLIRMLGAVALILAAGLARAAEDAATGVHILTRAELHAESRVSSDSISQDAGSLIRLAYMRTNLAHILGDLATERAMNDRLKKFGAKQMELQAKWESQLTTMAATRSVLLPNELAPEEIRLRTHLTEIVNYDFGQDYLWHTVRALQAEIALFSAAQRSDDAELKALGTSAVPLLKKQLAEARKIGDAMLKSGDAGELHSKVHSDPNAPAGAAPDTETDTTTGTEKSASTGDTGATTDEPAGTPAHGNPNAEPLPPGMAGK